MSNYVLVTPVKNEEEMLPEFADQVFDQSIKPVLWVIVDDGSDDKTPSIIRGMMEKNSWIEGVKTGKKAKQSYGFENYIEAVKTGIKKVNETTQNYDFLVKADVDIGLAEDYFEKLMSVLESNPKLGVASGILVDGKTIRKDYPYEGAIVYKKGCLDDIGGYIGHKTTLIKAKVNGWGWHVEPDLVEYHKRPSDARKGSLERGRHVYMAGHTFFTSLFYAAYYFFARNPREAGEFLCGYLKSYVNHVERIDEEVEKYYRKMPRMLIMNAVRKIPLVLKGKEDFESLSKGIHDEITKGTD